MEKIHPLVSICCWTYNHERFIKKAIDGFLMQKTNFIFEIIIGDDFSTDETRKICFGYKEKLLDKIKILERGSNVGASANSISVLNEARGKYLALCDGDDFWTDPHKLQKQVDEMEKNKNCDLSFHPAIILNSNGEKKGILANYGKRARVFKTKDVILGNGDFCPSSSVVFKKTLLSKMPDFYFNSFIGDYPLQIFGSLNGGVLYLPDCMSAYRSNIDGSWSQKQNNFNVNFENSLKFNDLLNKINNYLNFKYKREIKSRIVKNNYNIFKMFKNTSKDDIYNYENIEKIIYKNKPQRLDVFLSTFLKLKSYIRTGQFYDLFNNKFILNKRIKSFKDLF